jgi:hypothetical protein
MYDANQAKGMERFTFAAIKVFSIILESKFVAPRNTAKTGYQRTHFDYGSN